MPDLFAVGVTLFVTDRLSATLTSVARQLGVANAATKQFEASLARVKAGMVMGGAAMAIGAAPLMAITKSVEKAAELQMNIAKVTTGFKVGTDQVTKFHQELLAVSHNTIFSEREVTGIAQGLKQVGLNFEQITRLLPTVGSAAEVLYRMKNGIDPKVTGSVVGEFAHISGKYDTESIRQYSEYLTKVASIIPGGPQSLITSLGYLKPLQAMGADPIKLLEMSGFAQQVVGGGSSGARGPLSGNAMGAWLMGAAGVGGTALRPWQNMLGRAALGFMGPDGKSTIMPGGNLDPLLAMQREREAGVLAASGIVGEQAMIKRMLGAAGTAHLTKNQLQEVLQQPMIANILKGVAVNPGALTDLFAKLMSGQTGMRAAAVFGQPSQEAAFKNFEALVKNAPALSVQQQKFLDTLSGRWRQMSTDADNLDIEIGYVLIPTLTRWVAAIDSVVYSMVRLVDQHPVVTKAMLETTAAISALLVAGGAALVLKSLVSGLTLFTPMVTALIPAVVGGAAGLSALVAGMGLVTIAAVGAYEAWKNWPEIVRRTHDKWQAFETFWSAFGAQIQAQYGPAWTSLKVAMDPVWKLVRDTAAWQNLHNILADIWRFISSLGFAGGKPPPPLSPTGAAAAAKKGGLLGPIPFSPHPSGPGGASIHSPFWEHVIKGMHPTPATSTVKVPAVPATAAIRHAPAPTVHVVPAPAPAAAMSPAHTPAAWTPPAMAPAALTPAAYHPDGGGYANCTFNFEIKVDGSGDPNRVAETILHRLRVMTAGGMNAGSYESAFLHGSGTESV